MANACTIDDLTIAIGTLGDFGLLRQCLDSIYAEDAPQLRYQVCVVYNGPRDDGATERIRTTYPQVRLIERAGPLGYAQAYNLALERCGSRYVLLLDEDTIVKKGTLARMVLFMDAHPEVGMAGCRTLNADGSFQRSYGLVPSFRTELVSAFVPDGFWPARLYRDTSRVRDVEWLNGSFMLVRRDTMQAVGVMDERYTTVVEPDWCYRIRRGGWRVVYVPDAEIIHIGGQHSINAKGTTKDYVKLVRYHAHRYYFFRKHYGPLSVHFLRPIMIVGAGLRLFYYGVLYLCCDGSGRQVAAARLRTFWEVIKLSLGRKPDVA